MENIFGKKLKGLRERHFPGESLRRVSEHIKPESSFFTYLSRIEAGIVKPSGQFLKQIKDAYKLSSEEYNDLVTTYLAEDMQETISTLSTLVSASKSQEEQLVRQLFRKVKKKTNENTSDKKLGSAD